MIFIVFQNESEIIELLFQKEINAKNSKFIKHAVFNCMNRMMIMLFQYEISLKIDDE